MGPKARTQTVPNVMSLKAGRNTSGQCDRNFFFLGGGGGEGKGGGRPLPYLTRRIVFIREKALKSQGILKKRMYVATMVNF